MPKRLNVGNLAFAVSFCLVLGALALVWIATQFFQSEFPDVSVLKNQFPVVHYRGPDEDPSVTLTRIKPDSWVSVSEISRMAVGAIVVSEDWAFYQHKGIDTNQIKEAIKKDIEKGRFARGASTITQQVVRNVFLEQDKKIWRKIKEVYLAIRLEKAVNKRRILEVYLNLAEWGEGIYGIGPAARHYFKKSPSELTAKEGAFLAMLLPSPKRYSQSFRSRQLTDYARKIIDSILDKMEQAQYITPEERALEAGAQLMFEVPENPATPEVPEEESGVISTPNPQLPAEGA